MSREELRRTIEEPARLGAWEIEPQLVDLVLQDVGNEPGGLPFLSHALLETWRRRRGRILTLAGYVAAGRVQGAIAETANLVYTAISSQQQQIAKDIFLQLVEPSETNQDTKLRVKLDAFVHNPKDQPSVETVLSILVSARLVTAYHEEVEIAHEALIRAWPLLQNWLDADREFRTWQHSFHTDLHRWQKLKRDEGALLRGAPLAAAVEMLGKYPGRLSAEEKKYIEESLSRQRRNEQRRRLYLGVAVVVAVAMASLAGLALNRSTVAESRAKLSLAQYLAALAPRIIERNTDTELATLLTLEAYRLNNAENGDKLDIIDSTLRELLSMPYFQVTLKGDPSAPYKTSWTSTHVFAFSPDGRYIAVDDAEKGIRIWDLSNPSTEPLLLKGNTSFIKVLAFSPNSTTLASGSDDKTIWVWNLANRKAEPQILTNDAKIKTIAFSPDGKFLAANSDTSSITVWNITDSAAPRIVLRGHNGDVLALGFISNGALVSSGTDGTVRLWNLADLTSKSIELRDYSGIEVQKMILSPDMKILAVVENSFSESKVQLWNLGLANYSPVSLNKTFAPGDIVAFSPDKKTIAMVGWEGVELRKLANLDAEPILLKTQGGGFPISALAFNRDGNMLAASDDRGQVYVWYIDKLNASPVVHRSIEGSIWSVAVSPSGKLLASVDWSDTVQLWSLTDPKLPSTKLGPNQVKGGESSLPLYYGEPLYHVAISPDGHTLAASGYDPTIHLWNLTSLDSKTPVLSGHGDAVHTVAFSPDGKTLASGSSDKTVRLWNLANSYSQPLILTGHSAAVRAVAFSPDGNTLGSGSDDDSVRLWNIKHINTEPVVLKGIPNGTAIAFSPDGKRLATPGVYNSVLLWDMTNLAALPISLKGHENQVRSLAFSPDGKTLASGSIDKTVRLWDMNNLGAAPIVLNGHGDVVYSLAFTPDGKTLISSSRDGTLRLWIAQTGSLVNLACQKVRRNLTKAEWEQFLAGEPYRQTCPELPPGQ
jgi:WD40 repeat protein